MAEPQELNYGPPVVPGNSPFSELDPQPGVAPVKSPEELQARVSGWQRVLDKFTTDPAVIMGALRFGTQMMQPIAPGQNKMGHLGGALEDSINYASAARSQGEKQALERMRTESTVAREGAQTAQTAQETTQGAEKHPGEMKRLAENLITAQQGNKKTKAELDAVDAEIAAGLRTPEHLKRKSELDIRGKEGKVQLDAAHAEYYKKAAGALQTRAAAAGPGTRQILHSTKIENEDGTTSIVNSHAVNGTLYVESYTAPRFTDVNKARELAKKEVDKATPFFGKAPYEGTKDDEVERRVRAYTTPQRVIVGPGGQQLSPEQFENLDRGDISRDPKTLSSRERSAQSQVTAPLAPGQESSSANVAEIQRELARKDMTPAVRQILERELATETAKTGGSTQPVSVIRGPDGKLVIAGQGAEAQPAAAAPAAAPAASGLEAAQAALEEARGVLTSFGTIKRKRDPQGYLAAQKAVGDAKRALDAAKKAEAPEAEAEVAKRTTPLRSK